MSMSTLLLCIAMASFALAFGQRMPRAFAIRQCQGNAWRSTFPNASKTEIRQFLTMVVCAFGFAERDKLKLKPDDGILALYQAIYAHWWMVADAMELETLVDAYAAKYGRSFAGQWHERMTLGELFAMTHEQLPASGASTDVD